MLVLKQYTFEREKKIVSLYFLLFLIISALKYVIWQTTQVESANFINLKNTECNIKISLAKSRKNDTLMKMRHGVKWYENMYL